MFSELQAIGVKSPAHSIDIHIAPVLKTRTVQQAASLFVGRFVGECIRLRSTRKEEPKKSTWLLFKCWPVLASRTLRSWLGESQARAGVQEPVTHLRKLLFAEGLHENNVYVNLRKFEPRF